MPAEDVRKIVIRAMTDERFLSTFLNDFELALAEYDLTLEEVAALRSGDQDRIRRASIVPLPSWWPHSQRADLEASFLSENESTQLPDAAILPTWSVANAHGVGTSLAGSFDVYLLGLGIVGCRQLTRETESALKACRKVFVLWNEPAIYQCLVELGPEIVSLHYLYEPPGKPRAQVYHEMTEEILSAARLTPPVAFACYGHPLVYSTTSRLILDRRRTDGLRVKVVPGVSALDTLFVDLELDPAINGLQVYEATSALLYQFQLQPSVPCLLLQIGMLETSLYAPHISSPQRFGRLKAYLLRFYPEDHQVTFVLSASNSISHPKLVTLSIREVECIAETEHALMTLYIPPSERLVIRDPYLAGLLEDTDHLREIEGRPRPADW